MDNQIIINKNDTGTFDVIVPGKYADHLTWDEMLGLVAQITIPDERRCCQWLKTPEQHEKDKHFFESVKDGTEGGEITEVEFEKVM